MNRAVTTLAIALSLFPFTVNAQTPTRGFIVPEGATEIFALQKSQHLELLRSVPPGVGAPLSRVCDPTAPSFSWRTQGKVTSAKDQQQCGACWAFSAVSAVETSYMVFHNTNLLGPDLSEQELLDCAEQFRSTAFASIAYDCTGGWFEAPMRMAQVKGILGNPTYPATPPAGYRSAKGACQPVTGQRTPVNSWTPLPSVQGPNNWVAPDREIKEALCTYGGVAAALNSQGFPGIGATFTTPIEGPASGTSQSLTSSGAAVDHAIHIVGWDDGEGVWIIKNSWGENWGDMGFAKIRYGTRNIGFMATAAQANTALVLRALPPAAATDFLNQRENSITSFSTTLRRQQLR